MIKKEENIFMKLIKKNAMDCKKRRKKKMIILNLQYLTNASVFVQ